MAELKQYTRKQVEQSKDSKNTVFILHDKVYDVTSFLNEHPGGEEVLLEHRGMDASEDFDDVGHSQDAIDLMKQYLVGEIVAAERSNKVPKKGWVAGANEDKAKERNDRQAQGSSTPFYLLIAAFIGVIAMVYFSYV